MSDDVDLFLAHYGVKGMKWGVVKEDSTSSATRSESRSVKREASAQKFELKAKSYDLTIKELQRQTPKNFLAARSTASDIESFTKSRDRALVDADLKRQGKLTTTQKKVLIGAAVVGTIVASAVIYNGAQSGEFNRLALKGKSFLSQKQDIPFKKNAQFAEKMSPDLVHSRVVKDINPGYGKPGTKLNCRRATFAYELRRRGYDVQATKTTNSSGQNIQGLLNATTPGKEKSTSKSLLAGRIIKEQISSYKNPSSPTTLSDLGEKLGKNAIASVSDDVVKKVYGKDSVVHPEAIFNELSKQPNGSRGELGVRWMFGGGHSVAYEIFDGKPVIFDNQSGKKFDSIKALADDFGPMEKAGFTRLDNIELNKNFLAKWVKNAK